MAGLFSRLRAGVHRDADVGLRQRRSVVGAVAGHGDEPARGLLALDQFHLRFGSGLGKKVVDAGLFGDRRRRQRVVAGDHDRRIPIARNRSKRSRMFGLRMSLR